MTPEAVDHLFTVALALEDYQLLDLAVELLFDRTQ